MSSKLMIQFAHDLHLRIKLAVAFSIIANTPPGKSAMEYAQELQETLYKQWHEDDNIFENITENRCQVERAALIQQQQTIANQLTLLIPSPRAEDPRNAQNSAESGYDSCEKFEVDEQLSDPFTAYNTPLNFSEDVKATLGANFDFIRSLVRLQDLIGQDDDVISGERYSDVVNSIVGSTPKPNSASTADTRADNARETNRIVAKGAVQYALQTSQAKSIVKKSAQDILRHLCGIALRDVELPKCILYWEGSVLQQSTTVIRRLSDDLSHQKTLVKCTGGVARVLINNVLRNCNIEENVKHENQVTLLLQLCGNSTVCSEVLNVLMEQINNISSESSNFAKNPSSFRQTMSEKLVNVENYYYIFHLTERLLTRYFILQSSESSTNKSVCHNSGKRSKITDLWRDSWGKSENRISKSAPSQQQNNRDNICEHWCNSLENMAKIFSCHCPLISFYAQKCSRIITTSNNLL